MRECTLEIGHGTLHELRIATGDVLRANGRTRDFKKTDTCISRPRGRKAVATLLQELN